MLTGMSQLTRTGGYSLEAIIDEAQRRRLATWTRMTVTIYDHETQKHHVWSGCSGRIPLAIFTLQQAMRLQEIFTCLFDTLRLQGLAWTHRALRSVRAEAIRKSPPAEEPSDHPDTRSPSDQAPQS